MGVVARYGHRIDTFELQAGMALFHRGDGTEDELLKIARAAMANAEAVLKNRDELMPIATLLTDISRALRRRGLTTPENFDNTLAKISDALPARAKGFVQAASAEPDILDIVRLASASQQARYAEDAGYDLRHLRVMARQLVVPALARGDLTTLVYAAEVSADHGVLAGDAEANTASLLGEQKRPLKSAESFAKAGLALTYLMQSDAGLVFIRAEPNLPIEAYAEPTETFSAEAFEKWSLQYPFAYHKVLQDQFHDKAHRLGLSALPARTAIIAGGDLQQLPPGVLQVGGNAAGHEHRLAVVPSLSWLEASRRAERCNEGRVRAWIPIPDGLADTETLSLMRDDIENILVSNDIELERGAAPSVKFSDVDVAILGAHGGLAERDRYFARLSDDQHSVTAVADVADVLRNARVAILFVCSGGRLDAHPETGMAVGLAKQLLAKGLKAVIAPSWPIVFHVARPWLQGFLPAWERGDALIDACFEANQAVALQSSFDPRRYLAMTLYGDPLVRKISLAERT